MATSATSQVEQAKEMIKAGQYEQSLASLREAIQVAPETGEIWELKGIALYATRQIESARHALEVASVLKPLTMESQLMLADCYQRGDSSQAAMCILEHLATQAGEMPTCLLPKLAALLGACGNFQLAVNVCRRAVEVQPDCDAAAYGLAHYMGKVGYPPQLVLPVLRRAFDLAPNKLSYRIGLAQLMHRCGDSDQAYKLVAQLDIDDLVNVTCRCCVQRLMQVFTIAGDYRRCDWCRARLQGLDHSDC